MTPAQDTATPRKVWVAVSNANGCALTVDDENHGHHVWPGATWTEFIDFASYQRAVKVAGEALRNTIKWTYRAIDLEVSGSMHAVAMAHVKAAEDALAALSELNTSKL